MSDRYDPLNWLEGELSDLEDSQLRRSVRSVAPLPGGRCQVEGRTLVNFASNDYLGLAGDPRLREAAKTAIDDVGTGSGASALVTGHSSWHERLEQRIARFEGTPSALVFPTGFAANVGTISALVAKGDFVIGDRLNHASLIDGCRLSGATFRVYPHADVDRLDRELARHHDARRRLIVTDSVFSMDGDIAPVSDLVDLVRRHDAMLLVDEAHGTGVMGETGRGVVEETNMEARVPIRVGTLSKAVGSQGGFVAGSRTLIEWIRNRARTYVYSTALNPSSCAAAIAAFDIIDSEPERRRRLRELSAEVRARLSPSTAGDGFCRSTPIIPFVVGDAAAALTLARKLEERGLMVPAIRPPTVPRDTSRLRISVSATHTDEDIQNLITAIDELRVR